MGVVSQVIAVARGIVQVTFLLAVAAAVVMARTDSAAGGGPATPDVLKASYQDAGQPMTRVNA